MHTTVISFTQPLLGIQTQQLQCLHQTLSSEKYSTILHTSTSWLCSSFTSKSLNRWTTARLGMLQEYKLLLWHLRSRVWVFSFLSFKTMFKLHRSNDWCFSRTVVPHQSLPRGHTRHYSQTAQSFTHVRTEQTTGTSDLCAEGATHIDPSMLDTFTDRG